MKYSTLLSFLLLASLMSGCGGSDNPTPAEKKQLEKISGTWQLQNATQGTKSWNDEFENATLTLSGVYQKGGTYDFDFSVTPWPINSPWPADGKWKFKTTSGSDLTSRLIRLDDSVEINYVLSGNTLTLTFPYAGSGFPAGRTSSVAGNWTFVFTK